MKKIVQTVIVLAIIVLCTACGNRRKDNEMTKEKPKTGEMVLTFLTSQNWVNKESTIDSELNKKFEEETGIKIDMQVIPDDQYIELLKTRMSTGETPDIFMIHSGLGAKRFLPEEYFADLSEEEWVSRYTEYAKKETNIDGKTIGLMRWNLDCWGILYNKKIYEQYQLEVPHTKEEFFNICSILKENGITPIFECGKDVWHWGLWFSQYGAYVTTKHENLYEKLNSGEMKFSDVPEFEKFLIELKEMYNLGYLGEECLENSWNKSYEYMESEKGANFFAYQSYPQELVNKFPERELDEWEMYPIPLAGNNMSAYSTGGIMTVAYKDSKNLDAVKEFFRFLAREDNLKAFYAARGDLQAKPSFIDVPESPTVATASMEKNALGGDGVGMEYGILFWDNTQVGVHIQEMLIGNKSAKEVLEAIDTERKKMFDTLF